MRLLQLGMFLTVLVPVTVLPAPSAATTSAARPQVVTLAKSVQTAMGLRTQPAAAAKASTQIKALGRVLAPAPWLSLNTALETAVATAAASAAEARRLHRLYAAGRNASEKALQAAQAQARADSLKRDELRQHLRLKWGAALADLNPSQRDQLSRHLVDGDTVLVRASAPGAAANFAPASATLQALDGAAAVRASVLGPAPSIDPALQAPAWLLRVNGAGARELRPGQALRVWLQSNGPERHAIRVPETAIVRIGGRPYAYVQVAPERFEQRPLTLLVPESSGWLANGPIKPGEALVIEGADALWWAQQAPPPAAGEKAGSGENGEDSD